MAKKRSTKYKLQSTESAYSKTYTGNLEKNKDKKREFKKYDPNVRKHVVFKVEKVKGAK